MICDDMRVARRVLDNNPECDDCGRSLMSRWGQDIHGECPSCAADFERLNAAGKLTMQCIEDA